MQYTPVARKQRSRRTNSGVYAELDDLVRLRFKASGFSFLPRQPIHSVLAGRHASRLRGRGLNFEELRGYLRGDDPRHIDWRVTARTGEPHVRVYTEEKDRVVWLLVDQRISMFFGSRRRMKSVVAAEAAAVGAWRVLAQGDRVGALVFDDRAIDVFEPQRSEDQVMRILKGVVHRNHALNAQSDVRPGPAMLNRALERVGALARHDCLVCLVSDGAGIDRDTRRHVTRLAQHNDVLSVFVYDLLERDMPEAGPLVFSDGQSLLEFDTASRRLREAYHGDFEERLARMAATARQHAIPLLPMHTDAPVLEQLREALGAHRR
jgi:uncharacterized protein (DUF58 family)